MRALFLVLVLANVAFFAWARHYGQDRAEPKANPLTQQVDPEKLKIVPPPEPQALPPPAPKAAPAAMSAAPLAVAGCLEWGSFTLIDRPRAERALEPLALGSRLSARRTEEVANWWVYMPPQGSRQGALRKAGELKALGVEDYFIVGDESEWRWALSLGVYRTAEAAQARLEALRSQGVRSAAVSPRETVVPKVWLQMKGVDAALEARLREITRQMEGSELRSCS
jgi:hypothetical protein